MITLVIKQTVYGRLVMWEETSRAILYEAFLTANDDPDMPNAVYSVIRFEKL